MYIVENFQRPKKTKAFKQKRNRSPIKVLSFTLIMLDTTRHGSNPFKVLRENNLKPGFITIIVRGKFTNSFSNYLPRGYYVPDILCTKDIPVNKTTKISALWHF